MKPIVIENGHLLDPSQPIDAPRDLLLRDGLVAAVEAPGVFRTMPEVERIDARGLTVCPGLVDMHVHLREPGQTAKETIASGTQAAAAGGFTTVVAMPNTVPVTDSVATLGYVLSPERHAATRVFAMPAATLASAGAELTDFEALAAAGALGFTDDGKPILGLMREALTRAARLGLPVSQHAEDPGLSHGATMNAGPVAFRLGLRGYPNVAESSLVARDIQLVRELTAEGLKPHLHVQHISTAEALDHIRMARAEGLHVTCEAAPHHFTLTDAAIANPARPYDTNAKMNPPLRSEADRQAVIAALLDGTIDAIATDHAPHCAHEKEVEFERAPNGITGLETALGLSLEVLHGRHGMAIARVLHLLSAGPAGLLGLRQAGSLAPGSWADVLLFDPAASFRYDAPGSRSRSRNTPFHGFELRGRVRLTLVGGRVAYRAADNA